MNAWLAKALSQAKCHRRPAALREFARYRAGSAVNQAESVVSMILQREAAHAFGVEALQSLRSVRYLPFISAKVAGHPSRTLG